MKSNYINIKPFHSILLIVITLLMNVTLSFGQNPVKTTKITDGSIGSGINQPAVDFAILELESNTKGFLLPRMTTTERDALTAKITDKDRGNGLAIYNITDDCINYWSKTAGAKKPDGSFEGKWLSVCGALPPATVEMNNCNASLNASGQKELTQGRSLRDTDILYVSVNVIHSGSYTISAVSSNGYSFSKSGVFETSGVYSVALEGFGTPMEASSGAGDRVLFTINGKKDPNCEGTDIKVKSSVIDYTVLSATSINWKAYKGIALTGDDNRIELSVNVLTAGFWRIQSTDSQNGISFSGAGQFTQDDVGGEPKKIYLYGQGTPEKTGTNTFKFQTNSASNKLPNTTVVVETLEASFELACSEMTNSFEYRGEYQEGITLTRGNSITIPVKVINPGPIDVELIGSFTGSNSGESVKFNASSLFLGKKGEIQNITLSVADLTKIPSNTTAITFTSMKPESVALCQNMPTVPVKERSKVYTFNCSYISATGGSLRTNTPLTKGRDGIQVSVDVGYADTYSIKTNTINGVTFEKSGTFSDADRERGRVDLVIDGSGTPLESGSFNFDITATDSKGAVVHSCTASVNFRGPDINVLAIGNASYVPYGWTNYAPTDIITNPQLFGPNGKVKVNSIKLFNNSPYYKFPKNLSSYLESNNIDIVIVGYPTTYGPEERIALEEFIKVKKGVVIMTDESNLDTRPSGNVGTTNHLIANLSNGTYMAGFNGGPRNDASHPYTMINKVSGPSEDPIIKSDFWDLNGKLLGNDASGNIWYFRNLPSDYIPIATSYVDPSYVWIFRHRTLGFIFMGDGGIFSGRVNHNSGTIWPVAFDNSGNLFGKEYYYKGDKNFQVYNSYLYANTLKWAIDYVIKNR
ncbi:hypothetical protein NWE55_01055 [Myroides albus]|uniref:hypothetical protein n=1 Tax=Myroides albus TaxID=2562892 RepID=UPI002158A4F7|nr:hypothetical protein [Myroides albus]UVD79910.1 hypothetical protein NWE55_01055 [Myroides albus]